MNDDALTTDLRIADDGIERPDDGAPAPVARTLGFILDEPDEKKVAKAMVKLREDQNAQRSRNRAVWQRNAWWREGRRGVRLDKKQDTSQWEVKLPLGMGAAPPVPNKTDRLCRRLTNTLLVDKPYPDCEPGDDSNEARDAAEFATRYLVVKGSPAELNMNRVLRAASDKSQTYASAFGWVTMDPSAGGHRPRTMLAHPQAKHKDDALIDPTTGQPAEEKGLAKRFLRTDGFLSDNSQDADLQWLPSPKIRLLTGLQLDLLPATARGMHDAIGVVITDPTSLGDLRQLFPEAIEKLTADELQALCVWRPTSVKDVLPPYTTEPEDQKDEQGNYKDSQMVIVTTVYYESCAEYPFGCYAVAGGEAKVLHRQKWSAMMQGPDGASVEECLEIPVAQCRCLDDDTFDNPMGIGMAERLGPADEIRNMAFGFEVEHMFRAANPIPFLPIGSIVQPKQFLLRDGTPVFTNPQGKPEWENVPPLSSTVPELRNEMTAEMDDESGLQQAAQGVEDPSVQSGIHAQTIVQEALKAVTNMKDNIGDFYIGLNRIILQLSRAFCTVPQMLSYVGKDGVYKEKEWSRLDFRTTTRVSIAKGSFTMHTLAAKQQMANEAKVAGAIDLEEYNDIIAGGISPILGTQDNPQLMRVRRQIDQWLEGPTPEWTAGMATLAQANAEQSARAAHPMMAADASGQVAPAPAAPAPPLPPAPAHPFSKRLPVDLEPMSAKIRHRQLARTMASTKYETFPPEWCGVFDAEYSEMKNAAGIMTVPETQKAQAAEQQVAQARATAAQQLAAKTEADKTLIEQQGLAFDQQQERDKMDLERRRLAFDQANALPKGVSIGMKADASTVGNEEAAARGLVLP